MAAHRPAFSALLTVVASLAISLFLITSPVQAATAPGVVADVWQHYAQSWALGVVVPDGATLAGGVGLSWAEARNVTALLKLPNITMPGGVTYLVLSAEGDDGTVMQVAAGVWPGSDLWSVYSWFVSGATTASPSYDWTANCSAPTMAGGDLVLISTTVGAGAWGVRVQDLNTSKSISLSISSPALSRFKPGDQEVFALESYTRSVATFRGMGGAALLELLVDGQRVTGGWYPYGGWEPARSPLFAVGTAQPPTFITLTSPAGSLAVWSYDAEWTGAIGNPTYGTAAFAYAALAALVPVAFVLGGRMRRRDGGRT
jgi:hypothetical protein